jgi:hypothetical protein
MTGLYIRDSIFLRAFHLHGAPLSCDCPIF